MPSVAVLGTGRMGAPIARNLKRAGFPVTVWNRTVAKARALQDDGIEVALTPAQAASGADVLVTMLADGPSTEQAMLGDAGALDALPAEAVWIQMGTIGIDWTQRLAARAAERTLAFVDAPVSGSDGPARDAQLLILASGADELKERVEPLFGAVGRRTLWVGPAGGGSALKLVLNAWLAAITQAAAEGVALAETLGLDPQVFTQTLADLPLGAPYAVAKANAMIERKFEPGFALALAHKDVALAVAAATERGLRLPLAGVIDGIWGEIIAQGHGGHDVAAAVMTVERDGAETGA
jgi:3-hydroxyisobutyrate dehydrogenase